MHNRIASRAMKDIVLKRKNKFSRITMKTNMTFTLTYLKNIK